MNSLIIQAMERGWLPDRAIRHGIRNLCADRIQSLIQPTAGLAKEAMGQYVEVLKKSPLVVHAKEANEQHYELPAAFFSLVLGKNKKYSSAFWSENCRGLDEAEDEALRVTIERAELRDGMQILELGCGWGSLTLKMAAQFPNSSITALSNSKPQREWIELQLATRNLKNVRVLTRNIAEVGDLAHEFGAFDRVVSVEMFEHVRNYDMLFDQISSWLKPEGKLFVHIFTHKDYSYFFETAGEDNWLGRHFFTGGQMPAHGLFENFQDGLKIEKNWVWNGTHYGRTAEAWLDNLDAHKDAIMKILSPVYGKDSKIWFQRWRVFFMSCAELFNYKQGSEWGVSHYLLSRRGVS